MDPLVMFMMSKKGHKASLRMMIHHFAVLKTCFFKFDHDLNKRVLFCSNIFCEAVKCAPLLVMRWAELHCKDRNGFFVIKGPKFYLITTFIT